jgi:hypothetical protein
VKILSAGYKDRKGVFMKKTQTWAALFAALAFGALVLTGCSNPVSNRTPQTEEDSPDIPAGFGTIRVSLTQGEARTIMPAPVLSDLYLKYWFTKDSLSPEEKSPEGGVFTLEPGTYTLWVEAFVDSAKTELAADGSSASFVISAGTDLGTVNVALRPIASEGTGSLVFSLTYPVGGAVEYLTLTRIAGAETIDLITGVTPSGGDPLVFSGEKTGIASGYYQLDVRIRDGAGAYAGKSETAHIYQNLSAQAVYVFTAEDFSLYTVSFSAGAGSGTAPASIAANDGSDITLPGSGGMTAPANKFFIGWSDGATLHWPEDPYTVNGSVTLTARWELTAISEVEAYLDHAADGGAANPVPLPVNLALGGGGWAALLSALDTAGKYVALDLTDSAITGMSGTTGEFDPGTANTGEKYIVSLVLPDTATSIKAGNISTGAFGNFFTLTSVSGIGITAVSDAAFRYRTSLVELSFPAAISIGAFAFEGCTSLAALSLPAAASIGGGAFHGCTSLAVLDLPAVVSIDNFAFEGCMSLAALSLPATLTTIGYAPFTGCVNLITITVDPDNTAFKAQSGMLLNKAGTTLIAYPAATGKVTLDSVTAIGDFAFYGCTFLAEMSLPVATSIGNQAFYNCTSLAELSLPAAISIGYQAFYGCTSLTSVNLPVAASIDGYAFTGGTSLAALSLPAVTSIGDGAFGVCPSLAELSLPAMPPIVGNSMFYNINGIAQTITVKVLAASVSAYNTTWQTAFKGVGGSASALNTGSSAGTANTNITLILLAQYDDVSANVTLWANQDGGILGSSQDMRISKTASGNPSSFTVTVAGAYTLVQWQVNGIPLGSLGNPLTIAAADYAAGKTYILGVQVTKDGVPYSTDIRFTVEA